jgi:hypothetical protein
MDFAPLNIKPQGGEELAECYRTFFFSIATAIFLMGVYVTPSLEARCPIGRSGDFLILMLIPLKSPSSFTLALTYPPFR